MPRAPRKLAELDAAAASCNSLSAAVQFALEDNWRLLVLIETGSSRDGSTAYELRAASAEGRRPQGEPWTSSYKKLSTALRMLARKFPGLDAPSDLQMSCRGGSVPTSTLKHLLRDGLAEAFGREPEPPPRRPPLPSTGCPSSGPVSKV